MQTFLENKKVEPVEPIQMSIYQSHTYRKDLSWLHFNDVPRVQERQQVKSKKQKVKNFTHNCAMTQLFYVSKKIVCRCIIHFVQCL